MRTRLAALVAGVALVGGLAPAASVEAAHRPVRIEKIRYDSPGADTGSNRSLNAEWVSIRNYSARAKTLTGWTLRDGQGHVFRFPRFTLKPGRAVRIHTGRGRDTASDLYWRSSGYVWNNTGDKATLKKKRGGFVDSCRYGGSGSAVTC